MNASVRWTSKALGDLERLHTFLSGANPRAAAQVVRMLVQGAGVLRENPCLGTPLGGYEPREVRRIMVGQYEMRYEVHEAEAIVLRLWHTREDR